MSTTTRATAGSAVPADPAPRTAPPPRPARRRKDRAGYLFLLPWFIGMLFTVIPFFASLYLAFTDYNLLNTPGWIGLDNFQEMLNDPLLRQSLKVTFIYTFVSVPLSLVVALVVAMMLNHGIKGLPIYRAIFYLPSLLGGSVAIVLLWKYIFGFDGIVNGFLGWFGIDGPGWTTDPDHALTTLIILHIWTFGSPMVIFLAGLRQIPTMYYEAAAMDGATKWRQFRSVTLPLLSPIIFFNLIQSLITSFQTFTQGFIMSGGTGGPAGSTMFYNLYLYQQGFSQFNMGYASAMAWVLLIIIAAFTALNFLVAKYWVFYEN
ncbi:sugar ABC transporter permease [Plantactinospora sp. ZYX-F-223]|uniref:carbohydrate ABC transporter permease n=1 Tax=Plantactinospora sp. ZYX-F-223 TaxID=3144103 RepID=UPI0031FC7E14